MRETIATVVLGSARLYREAIACRLAAEPTVCLLGSSAEVGEFLAARSRGVPDVVLVHCPAGGPSPPYAVAEVADALPEARIVVLSPPREDGEVMRSIEAGAVAWLGDDTAYEILIKTITAVRHGRAPCPSRLVRCLFRRMAEFSPPPPDPASRPEAALTAREREVARLVARGLANKQIARRLSLSLPTIKSYLHSLMKKLAVRRRRDLLHWPFGEQTLGRN